MNDKTLMEAVPFPVVITSLEDDSVLYINRQAAERLGVPQEKADRLQAPDYWMDPAEHARMVEALKRDGQVSNFEAYLKDAHGADFRVWLSASLTDFDGRPAAFVAFNEFTERKRLEEALRENEARYRMLAEHTFDVIWTMDLAGRYTYFSPSVRRLRGYTPEEAATLGIDETLAPESARIMKHVIEHLHETGRIFKHRWELEVLHKDGRPIWAEVLINAIRDGEGRISGLLGITRDITRQRQLREELLARSAAIEAAADAILITGSNGKIEYINPAFTRITGHTPDEALVQKPDFFCEADNGCGFCRQFGESADDVVWDNELVVRHRSGAPLHVLATVSPVRDERDRIIRHVAILHDVTERKQLQERLEWLAHFDALTGLPNRTLFFDRLNHLRSLTTRSGDTIALLFVDLDGFKDINDRYGHGTGDLVLQETARRMRGLVRESDTVGRFGGDEFTVLLANTTQPIHADRIAEKILSALSQPIVVAGRRLTIGASIGISLLPGDATNTEELLKHADIAMYEAKHAGKNRIARYAPTYKSMKTGEAERSAQPGDLYH